MNNCLIIVFSVDTERYLFQNYILLLHVTLFCRNNPIITSIIYHFQWQEVGKSHFQSNFCHYYYFHIEKQLVTITITRKVIYCYNFQYFVSLNFRVFLFLNSLPSILYRCILHTQSIIIKSNNYIFYCYTKN